MLYFAEHRYWATTVGQISCTLHHHGLLAGPLSPAVGTPARSALIMCT